MTPRYEIGRRIYPDWHAMAWTNDGLLALEIRDGLNAELVTNASYRPYEIHDRHEDEATIYDEGDLPVIA